MTAEPAFALLLRERADRQSRRHPGNRKRVARDRRRRLALVRQAEGVWRRLWERDGEPSLRRCRAHRSRSWRRRRRQSGRHRGLSCLVAATSLLVTFIARCQTYITKAGLREFRDEVIACAT